MKRKDEIKQILEETEKQLISKQKKQSTIDGIYDSTNAFSPKELKIKNTEDEKLKFDLIGGGSNSIHKAKSLIAEHKQPYLALFPNTNPYYERSFKMIGINGDPKKYVKDIRMKRFTLDTIYQRFAKEILPELRLKKSFLKGVLRNKAKLFQFLDEDGRIQAEKFRDESNALVLECNYSIYDFGKAFGERYGISFQLELYKDNNIIS